jgi:hypothetical protein
MISMVVDTVTPRHGRRFEPLQELALHATAIAASECLPNAKSGLTIVRELVGPIGIPDFTALIGNPARVLQRQRSNVPTLTNEIDAGIVASLNPSAGRSLDWTASQLGWPKSTLQRRVGLLLKMGAVHHVGGERFVRDESLGTLGRIYAVEAKVDDWRSALRQVRTYRVWADSYLLVMGPLTDRVLAQLVPEVAHDRGGLVVDGKWLLRPRLGHVAPARRIQAAEAFAASTIGLSLDPTF